MSHDDSGCHESAQPLAARSVVVGERGFHLWGTLSPDASYAEFVDPVEGPQVFNPCRSPGGLWQVTTTVIEYRRFIREGTAQPLPDDAFTRTPPGVSPGTNRTIAQLALFASDGVDFRRFEMDANQSLIIVAQDVCVRWMGPPGTRNVQGMTPEARDLPLSGIVIDSFLGVAISRIEVPPGDNSSVLLTKHLYAPAGERPAIEIPAYAKSVTINQEPLLGASSVMWTACLGDPNSVSGGAPISSIPFIPGQRKTQPSIALGNVSHLQPDVDPVSERFFELVFTIRP